MRLADLNIATVAILTHQRCVAHARNSTIVTGYAFPDKASGGSAIFHTMSVLAHYATTGVPPHGGYASLDEYLQGMACSLYLAAENEGDKSPDIELVANPETEWGIVLLAARARLLIHRRQPVTLAALAALASVSPSRLRQLVASDELPTDGGKPARVKAADAKKLLDARGVAGPWLITRSGRESARYETDREAKSAITEEFAAGQPIDDVRLWFRPQPASPPRD